MPFQTGESGNINGRPRGTGSRQQVFQALVEPHKEALFQKAIDLALEGNEAMLRLFLDRILPAKPKDEPVHIDMQSTDFNSVQIVSEFGLQSLKDVIAGKITPEEAAKIAALIGVHHKMFSVVALNEKLDILIESKNVREIVPTSS
jgi:hypothetical protein